VAVVIGKLVDDLLTHRGITHTLAFGIFLGLIVTMGAIKHGLRGDQPYILGAVTMSGVAIHVFIGDR